MSNAHGGVCSVFGIPSVPRPFSAILLSPFEFHPSSQRTRGRTENREGEVSDPPFFGPGTSPSLRECSTPCTTGVKSQGGRSLLH